MSGSSIMFAWVQKPWLFIGFLDTTLIILILLLPSLLALLEHYLENKLKHFSDAIYDYYSSFFFNQSEVPSNPESKVMKLSFGFFILIFMSFYIGTLTERFFVYKNFKNINSVEDTVNEKINIYDPYKYMLLGVGAISVPMPGIYSSEDYENYVLTGKYQISSIDDTVVGMLVLKHCNWYKIVENVIQFPLAALFGLGMKENPTLTRKIGITLLDEYLGFSMDVEFESFKETHTEIEGVEWCQNKIKKEDFNIYRLSDFFMLWVVYVFGLIPAIILKFWQVFKKKVDQKRQKFIYFGIRATANASLTKGLRKTLNIWASFSCFFMSSCHILRRKKILKKLHQIRAKVSPGKAQRVFQKALSAYEKFKEMKRADKPRPPIDLDDELFTQKSAINLISSKSFGETNRKTASLSSSAILEEPLERKKLKKEKSQAKKAKKLQKASKAVFPYRNIVEFFFMKFLGSSSQFFLSFYKEPFFKGTIPTEVQIKFGEKNVYFVAENVRTAKRKKDVRKLAKRGRARKPELIHERYFKEVVDFYENRFRLALNFYFQLNETILQEFKLTHPEFKNEIQSMLEVNLPYFSVFDNFVSNLTRVLAHHTKKEAIRNYKNSQLYRSQKKKMKQKRLQTMGRVEERKIQDGPVVEPQHLKAIHRDMVFNNKKNLD